MRVFMECLKTIDEKKIIYNIIIYNIILEKLGVRATIIRVERLMMVIIF